jgi:tetratricopeptide (TPR) repeat protein
METVKLLLQLYFRPASAMSDLLDKGSWLLAAGLVLLVSIAFFLTVNARLQTAYHIPALTEFYQPGYSLDEDSPEAKAQYYKALADFGRAMTEREKIPGVGDAFFRFFSFEPNRFYQPLLSLTVFYVPFVILLMSVFGGAGGFGVALVRSYGELATCTLTAWAAAHLPFAVAGILLYSQTLAPLVLLGMWAASGLLFGVLMIFALRTVFGANYAAAALVVGLGWIALTLGMYVSKVISPWLFSPFLLFYAYMYFGGALTGGVRGFGDAFRQKQNFKRFLHNATVNPQDADAHVQLGLIYLQRRQEAKAREHLSQAFAIDASEIDANYELGKLARQRGEFQTALDHFAVVLEQNDKHALSEVWREVGATYLEAGMLAEACEALEKFAERRPVDSEGLYYLGKALKAQGENEKAHDAFTQAIESAKIAPDYRRRELRYWSKLAQKEI